MIGTRSEMRAAPRSEPASSRPRFNVRPQRVLALLLTMVGLLVGLHVLSQWLRFYGHEVFGREFEGHELFDLNWETSVPTWWQQSLLLVTSGLAALVGVSSDTQDRWRRHWLVLAAVLLLMSIDEGVELHERLVEPVRDLLGVTGGIFWFAWVVPALVAVVVFAVAYVSFWRALPRCPRRWIAGGAVVFVAGAVGAEMIDAVAFTGGTVTFGRTLLYAVEEGLEMLGAVAIAYAILVVLSTRTPISVVVEPANERE
jgi:hypothetical protein